MFARFKNIGLVLTFATLPLSVSATTLADALVLAYQTHPRIIGSQANMRATYEALIAERSKLLPQLKQQVNVSRSAGLNQTSGHRDPHGTWSAETSATVQLFDGGADRLSIEATTMNVFAQHQSYIQLEQLILLETVAAYVDVRSNQQFVRLAKNNVRVLSEQVRAVKNRFEVGEVTRTDVAQAEARLAAVVSKLETSQRDLTKSKNAYTAVVGVPPRNLRNPPPAPMLPSTLTEAEAVAMEKHPDIIQAQFEAKDAELAVKSASRSRRPVINGTVRYNMGRNFGSDALATDDITAGITGTYFFYKGGNLDSEHRRRIALHQAALSKVQKAGYETRQDLRDEWATWKSANASIKAYRQQVEAAQVAFDGVREEARLGARTTLDTLDAEQELMEARSQLVTAISTQYVAQYKVLKAMGLMTAKHLNLGVPIYNLEENFQAVTKKKIGNLGRKRNKLFEKLKKRNGG